MHSLRRAVAFLAVALGLVVLAQPVRAADDIRICVVAILATDRDATIDPKVRCIAREVQKQEPQLTGFRLATTNCKPVAVGAKETFALVESEVATVLLQQGMDKEDRVRLTVKAPLVGEITYTTVCTKCFPIITRYQTIDKDRLIIAVMVRQPCKAK
jgi:hypothetical protein